MSTEVTQWRGRVRGDLLGIEAGADHDRCAGHPAARSFGQDCKLRRCPAVNRAFNRAGSMRVCLFKRCLKQPLLLSNRCRNKLALVRATGLGSLPLGR